MGNTYVGKGQVVNNMSVKDGDYLYISSGGVAIATTVNGGELIISGGGIANTVAQSGGHVWVQSGGSASNVNIAWGYLFVDGTADTSIVNRGGGILLKGIHRGSLTMSAGAVVSAYSGAKIDFSVSERKTTDGYLINNLSLISGTPTYTITVSSSQATGTYKLAQGASGFTGSVTVGDGTADYGVLSVNGAGLDYNGSRYVLAQSNGNLTLDVLDITPPVAPVAAADVTTWTNQSVTVTATFAEDSVLNEYSLNGGTWTECTSGVVFSANGTVSFRSTDAAGNVSEVTGYTVSNIDKVAPTVTITADDTAPYAPQVILSAAIADEHLTAAEYSFDGSEWLTYTDGGVMTTANGAVYFRGTDAAGNVTSSAYEVTNIGDAPVKIFSSGVMTSRGDYFSGVELGSGGNDSMTVASGGTVVDTIVSSGGQMEVASGGVANNNTMEGGSLAVGSGGVATGIKENSGSVAVDPAAVAVFVPNQIQDAELDDVATLHSGTTAENATVVSGGQLNVSSGGAAVSATVSSGGQMVVSGGGTVESAVVSSGGEFDLVSGGTATGVEVASGGALSVQVAPDTVAQGTSGGSAFAMSGGVLSGFAVNENTRIEVVTGGAASDITVTSGGVMILSGGEAGDTAVTSGGQLNISDGGVHHGALHIESGAEVTVAEGGVIDFAVAERTAEDESLINDLSRISGAPSYTITVSAEQADGTYRLAQGAADFTGSITVGDGTTVYGTVTVNGEFLEYNDRTYILNQSQGDLTLTITGTSEPILRGDSSGVSWFRVDGTEFAVGYSMDDFATSLAVTTTGNAVDHYGVPGGTYQWRVNGIAGGDIPVIGTDTAQLLQSDADGNLDVFFAVGKGTWYSWYCARHRGTSGNWSGTGEKVKLQGKNQLTDIFAGSDDANLLVMTDDANGDALFLDDIFSDSPVLEQQARISQIKEIRAGAGDDLVDLTSQRFAYVGDGVIVYGGLGDDTVWANGGNNILFGDAGNDRLVGASGDDVLVGGAGNDSMHGGGGNDIFTFGANWGIDTVEQLADGTVTLWFESDSGSWDESTRTYTDGLNSVTVTGAAAVTLKFGGDVSALPAGAFAAAASEKIFEDKGRGLLA